MKPYSDKPRDSNLHVVEIPDDDVSALRTLTTIKEPNNVNISIVSLQSKPQGSSESMAEPDSRKLLPI